MAFAASSPQHGCGGLCAYISATAESFVFSRIMHCRRAAHEFPLLPFPPQLIVLQLLLPVAICAIVSVRLQCAAVACRSPATPGCPLLCCPALPPRVPLPAQRMQLTTPRKFGAASYLLTLLANSMRQDLCNGTVSVRPSICLSQLSTAAAACGGFAAVGPADRRYRSIAARQHAAAKASNVTLSADVGS